MALVRLLRFCGFALLGVLALFKVLALKALFLLDNLFLDSRLLHGYEKVVVVTQNCKVLTKCDVTKSHRIPEHQKRSDIDGNVLGHVERQSLHGERLERLNNYSAKLADRLGLPDKDDGDLSDDSLGYVDAHEVDVKQRPVDRMPLHLSDETDVAPCRPFDVHLDRNVGADLVDDPSKRRSRCLERSDSMPLP